MDDEARRGERAVAKLKGLDERPALVRAAQAVRRMLPGDAEYGDPLSTAGTEPANVLGRRLNALTAERPSALREAGLSALQVWQALSEAQGRGRGDVELTIVFTDLVDFSSWALEAGDEAAVELLRCVGLAVEPALQDRGGRIVKRLGDGHMAVFADAPAAVEAALEATRAVEAVEVAGYSPRLRAGVHLGRPRKLGGDYYGVDVNIAARVADAAGAGEVLVSEAACRDLEGSGVNLKRKKRFKAKGAPKELKVFAAEPVGQA